MTCCRSSILLAADRWDEALDAAEEAWALAPGAPVGAWILGAALTRCGRIEDAAERLAAAAADCQSYELTITAINYGCAVAERRFPDGLEAWGGRARALSATLNERAPIADRTVQCTFGWIRDEEVLGLLEQAVATHPLDVDAWSGLAHHLWKQNQPLESVDALQRGIRQLPEDVHLQEILIHRLLDLGRGDEAVQVARDSLAIHPRGAYCWYLLGKALSGSEQHTDAREMETAFRTALKFNAGLFDAADELAITLAGRRRFSEAREVIESIRERLDDPCPAKGRLAWLLREEGRRPEATAAMAEVVGQAPWYTWGWEQLMRWIEADEDWKSAETWLQEWPDVLQDEARLRALRLEILDAADLIPTRLDGEWRDLLHDFRLPSIDC